jgi:NO-binding membrane sensor protein with MHYT domain
MQATVNGFSYGIVTPVAAFVMACLGGALGLRCAAPSLRGHVPWRPAVLVLAAVAMGCGFWTMHFIAMMGFSVEQGAIGYDRTTMFASLAVGTVMIGIGLFIVGHRGSATMGLVTGGTIMGLGIASMHYLGMAGLQVNGRIDYATGSVVASVAIGVVASTGALWAVVRHRGVLAGVFAALALGLAATGMHYTAMAGATVRLARNAVGVAPGGAPAADLLLPMLVGPGAFLVLAALVMLFEPRLLSEADRADAAAASAPGALPAQRPRGHRSYAQRRAAAGRDAPQPVRRGSRDFHDW